MTDLKNQRPGRARAGVLACRRALLGGTVLATVLAFGSDAYAEKKVYHGSVCVPDPFDDVNYSGWGIEMIDNTSSRITCPLVRDWHDATDSINKVWVEITNTDDNNDLDVQCILFTQIEDNASGNFTDFETQDSTKNGFVQLTFDSVETYAGDEASYSLRCNIGPGDTIMQITVDERT